MPKGRIAQPGARGRPKKPPKDEIWKIAATEVPDLPEGLQPAATNELARISRYLVALKRISAIDRQTITAYVTQWARFSEIMRRHLSDPETPLSVYGRNCEIAHPMVKPLLRAAKTIMKKAGEFGLTARTRDLGSDHGNRKSSALKKLLGNQRKVAEDTLMPSVVPFLPEWGEKDMEPPVWMNDRARDEYYRLGQQLENLDLFTPLDVVPLAVGCCLFDLFLRSVEQLNTGSYLVDVFDKKGNPSHKKEHPLHEVQVDLHDTLQAIWKDYGQTPRFRQVFENEEKGETDEVPMVFKGKFG